MSSYNFSRTPAKVSTVNTKHRSINSPIPALGTKEVIEKLEKVESRSMQGQLPIVWAKAEGFNVYDIAHNKFIDFTSTIFVANVGHSHPKIKKAILKVLDKSLLSTYAYANEDRANYLSDLTSFAGEPLDKAFLLSAGTEATEAVLKLIRMHGAKIGKRGGVVTLRGNWHGRTMGAQMMSSNEGQKAWIGYQDPNIHHIEFPLPWQIDEAKGHDFFDEQIKSLKKAGVDPKKDISGFMLETFQGWGALFYPKTFVQAVRKFCDENQILLAFDEMQAGFARTGKKFGFEHYQVRPDLIACGKGMGGGVPLSGVIGRAEIMDLPEVGNMSSTHSANPLVCAVGSAVLQIIDEENLVAESARKGEILRQGLADIKNRFPDLVFDYFGEGLIAALHLKDSEIMPAGELGSRVSEKCMQKGLLVVHTGRESIKIGPPLIITDEALIEGIAVLSESIGEVYKNG